MASKEEKDFMSLCKPAKATQKQIDYAISLCTQLGRPIPKDLHKKTQTEISDLLNELIEENDKRIDFEEDKWEPDDHEDFPDPPDWNF